MRNRSIFLAVAYGVNALAWADTYDPATNQLTIDSVELDGTLYNNVVVKVGDILKVGGWTALSATQPKLVGAPAFSGGSSPKVQITFNTDMASDASTIGDFTASKAYWQADKRTYVVELAAYSPGGSIIFVNSGFKSVTGEHPLQSVSYTFPNTWATVGTPTWTRSGYGAVAGPTAGSYTQCLFTLAMPVSGSTPVTFTGWSGAWSNGHKESGLSNITVDPLKYDSLQWLSNQSFLSLGTSAPLAFNVTYTISYTIPATGQSGSVSTLLDCHE